MAAHFVVDSLRSTNNPRNNPGSIPGTAKCHISFSSFNTLSTLLYTQITRSQRDDSDVCRGMAERHLNSILRSTKRNCLFELMNM